MKLAPFLVALVAALIAFVLWLVLAAALGVGERPELRDPAPPTVPLYADCSGESPVDPCVTPQP